MAGLGPFEPAPCLAVAVSGGADSLATALLVRDWARARGGDVLGLVVDHGLRAASAAEAALTVAQLAQAGIAAECLTLTGLAAGPALAERARHARHAVLEAACRRRGLLHLVFGHHAGDQAETLAMRMLARSGPSGLSGMAALAETSHLRRLRPLLTTPPARLRATLAAAGLGWVEDPSNADATQLRARLRRLRADPGGTGLATAVLVEAAYASGQTRAREDRAAAAALGAAVRIHPQGFAILADSLPAAAFAALLGMLAGAARPPAAARVAALAAAPRPATIAGIRLLPAGRLGPGLLLVREVAAMQPPVPAERHTLWDGRFRLADAVPGAMIGAWGTDAPRDRTGLPTAVLRTLPVLRRPGRKPEPRPDLCLAPRNWAAGADFSPLHPFS